MKNIFAALLPCFFLTACTTEIGKQQELAPTNEPIPYTITYVQKEPLFTYVSLAQYHRVKPDKAMDLAIALVLDRRDADTPTDAEGLAYDAQNIYNENSWHLSPAPGLDCWLDEDTREPLFQYTAGGGRNLRLQSIPVKKIVQFLE